MVMNISFKFEKSSYNIFFHQSGNGEISLHTGCYPVDTLQYSLLSGYEQRSRTAMTTTIGSNHIAAKKIIKTFLCLRRISRTISHAVSTLTFWSKLVQCVVAAHISLHMLYYNTSIAQNHKQHALCGLQVRNMNIS